LKETSVAHCKSLHPEIISEKKVLQSVFRELRKKMSFACFQEHDENNSSYSQNLYNFHNMYVFYYKLYSILLGYVKAGARKLLQ